MKYFNTTAVCIPSKHYMVDISERVKEIKNMVDAGKYFTINRARQYGKTTTVTALERYIADEYDVISIDFQDMTDAIYSSESRFTKGLSQLLCDARASMGLLIPESIYNQFQKILDKDENVNLNDFFRICDRWCAENEKPVVLIIDEVDSATNNQVFLDFLAKLRAGYIKREKYSNYKTFQSVILAGVTDIRYVKSKIRDEDTHKVNSPWNIAADFNIDMSLSEVGIKGMLDEYETDHNTGMDTAYMAKLIREYTNGYPFLVSRICQLIDTEVSKKLESLTEAWTRTGMDEAVKLVLTESNTLFQSLTAKLNNYPELKSTLRSVLMEGKSLLYNPDQSEIIQSQMYGFVRNEGNVLKIDNRIFETRLYNLFLSDDEMKNNAFFKEGGLAKNQFINDGKLDMCLIMERFIVTFNQIFGPLEDKFKEKDGRELFLLYLKPIINGTGNYYIEAQTRDQTRTDVIVDYLGQQYIIELKIWHGPRYNEDGEKQLKEYLDYFNLDKGYMLSFNFNKNKEQGIKEVMVGKKVLIEATV